MNDVYTQLNAALKALAGFLWGPPLVILLLGGGLYFLLYSRLLPYRHLGSGIRLLMRPVDQNDEGQLSHFQALSTALSGTLGMGNVAGVAVAIAMGGPGAIFWMWMSALVGIATKFYTCTLAVMYRGRDSEGQLQGGPMYIVREGLGPKWKPLAYFFALAGLLGTMPIFQINQLVEVVRDGIAVPAGWTQANDHFQFDLYMGLALAALVYSVVSGKLPRLARVTSTLVPSMVLGYMLLTLLVLVSHAEQVLPTVQLILHDAFSGQAAAGGAIGAMIITGVRRAAFSNEAGIGTEAMAHGAARTAEPVREGLVAMLGPMIDTLIVCTCTALVILISGVWQQGHDNGVSLTVAAFDALFAGFGGSILAILAAVLSLSTVFTFWYYGSKCLGFLIGARYQHHYVWFYLLLVVLGSVATLSMVISIVDSMYALMAVPTMIAALRLSPRVNQAARAYFSR
ncbi:MAG: alanine/glycine:cation symporter family protein [Alcanivorax sp.]|nr:alanine/glycine:cation symporter family protein [Alcanivorax sp.]